MMKYPLRRLVRDEINSRIILAKRGVVVNNYSNATIRRIADRAIAVHDARYNDFIGGSLLIGALKLFVLPLLISTVTGAAQSSVRAKVIDPILDKTIWAVKRLIGIGPDDPMSDKLFDTVIAGIGQLIKFFRAENSPIANKLQLAFNKIKGLK